MKTTPSSYLAETQQIAAQLTDWRRDFHRHPELRFNEYRTAEKIASFLRSLNLDVQTGVAKTGVTAMLHGCSPSPVVLLRFDMDALPISEENRVEYASENPGVMHACGHDTHIAMGLGTAAILTAHRHELQGSVKFVFQPAEEGAGGARAMIAEGVLENPKPNYAFGVHIDAARPVGTVAIGEGYILSAADTFCIRIRGRGGHGALPEQTIDPLMTGVQIVNSLQTIISRNVGLLDSALISVCSFQAGSSFNVIPDSAELSGTIRTYDPTVQERVHRRMREVVEHTALSAGASAEVEIENIVQAAWNDPAMAALSRRIAAEIPGIDHVESEYRVSPSDDLAEFLAAAPGCQFIIGAALGNGRLHHNPHFDIDESALPLGTALFCAVASELLS